MKIWVKFISHNRFIYIKNYMLSIVCNGIHKESFIEKFEKTETLCFFLEANNAYKNRIKVSLNEHQTVERIHYYDIRVITIMSLQ